jgi:hypothetical protein
MDFTAIAKDFGFPVVCVFGCAWFIRWLVMDRIKALETAFKASLAREIVAQEERIRAANRFADAMENMAEKTTRALERNTAVAEKNQDVLGRLMEHLSARPCLLAPADEKTFHQDTRPPSRADIPAVQPPTERTERARAHG